MTEEGYDEVMGVRPLAVWLNNKSVTKSQTSTWITLMPKSPVEADMEDGVLVIKEKDAKKSIKPPNPIYEAEMLNVSAFLL